MGNVLVVDSDASICELVSDVFRDWSGTRVIATTSALVGCWRARRERFTLAIIDAALPRWCGFIISEIAARNRTPSLLLSAGPDSLEPLTRNDYPFLRKPFSIEELLAASREAIARTQDNVTRVIASGDRLRASGLALAMAIEDSRRLIGEARACSSGHIFVDSARSAV